jgi:hypothetical protein
MVSICYWPIIIFVHVTVKRDPLEMESFYVVSPHSHEVVIMVALVSLFLSVQCRARTLGFEGPN